MMTDYKDKLKRTFPGLYNYYVAVKGRRHCRKEYGTMSDSVAGTLFPNKDYRVISGPFAGMKYLNETVWGPIAPKWIGSYEGDLHPVLEEIFKRGYDKVIDVGSAEGYYAAGLAYRIPNAIIYAFDIDPLSRNQTKRLAELNGLQDRVIIGKLCEYSHFERIATGNTLVVCDIEGFEKDLLDPDACSALKRVDILVEVHEFWEPGQLGALFIKRFSGTHEITDIRMEPKSKWLAENEASFKGMLPPEMLVYSVDEFRYDRERNYWLWLKRKA